MKIKCIKGYIWAVIVYIVSLKSGPNTLRQIRINMKGDLNCNI